MTQKADKTRSRVLSARSCWLEPFLPSFKVKSCPVFPGVVPKTGTWNGFGAALDLSWSRT